MTTILTILGAAVMFAAFGVFNGAGDGDGDGAPITCAGAGNCGMCGVRSGGCALEKSDAALDAALADIEKAKSHV